MVIPVFSLVLVAVISLPDLPYISQPIYVVSVRGVRVPWSKLLLIVIGKRVSLRCVPGA